MLLMSRKMLLAIASSIGLLGSAFVATQPGFGEVRAREAKKSAGIGLDVEQIPTRVRACDIEDIVTAPARIESLRYQEVRANYMTMVKKIHVAVGEKVKPGQLLATADTESLNKMLDIYVDYLSLIKGELNIVGTKLRDLVSRRVRVQGLFDRQIVSLAELDSLDKTITSAKYERDRLLKQLETNQKSIEQYNLQIKNANFYSQINGEVTQLIADPRAVTGFLTVMPGSMVAKVEQAGAYSAYVSLLDSQMHGIHIDMTAAVHLPDGSSYPGRVSNLSILPVRALKSDANASRGNGENPTPTSGPVKYLAKIEFSRQGPILPSGLHASVDLVVGRKRAMRCLPWNAIEVVDGNGFVRSFQEKKGWSLIPVALGKKGMYDVVVLTELGQDSVVMARLW